MTQAEHYRDQSNRARRLAEAVKDPEASKKLIEMAEEFRLYAERLEQTHYAERLDALNLFSDGVRRRSLSFCLPSPVEMPGR